MNKAIILIILGCLVMGFFLWRQDKKKKEQELADRLYNAENNITHLNNLNNKRRFKWKNIEITLQTNMMVKMSKD